MQKSTFAPLEKVIRISNNNYKKIIKQWHYGDTFDSILSRILDKQDIKEVEK